MHLTPPLRVTPFEFCRNLRHQKTRIPGLLCGVCVILRLAVSVEHQFLQTDDDGIYRASTASRGKNRYYMYIRLK